MGFPKGRNAIRTEGRSAAGVFILIILPRQRLFIIEVNTIMKILMCTPTYYDVIYEINPWMNKICKVNQISAQQQWLKLYETIQQCGAQIELVPPVPGLPDLVFTANAGLLIGKRVFLSRFRFPERQNEYEPFKNWFLKAGYKIVPESPQDFRALKINNKMVKEYIGPTFEGAGDGLFVDKTLFAAYGFRTDKNYFERFRQEQDITQIIFCELTDPYFYHLDTCFCPLNATQALWWPHAFNQDSQQRMKQAAELFAIPADEAKKFACNSVVLDDKIIIPSDCPQTAKILTELNFKVYVCEMTEYIKAGGACKCLTLALT